MAVTMQDIGRGVNVSVVTVSKVLRNKGKISVATRQRVLRRAKKLNYQTNWIARSLVTRRTFTIGLLLPDFTHPFFSLRRSPKPWPARFGRTAITCSFHISKKTQRWR